jgi:hypothetical protein
LSQSFSDSKAKLIDFNWILRHPFVFHIDFDFPFTNHNSFI